MIENPSSTPEKQDVELTTPQLQQQIAELRLQVADRDRRLSELAEQSLQILDRLAEARDQERDRSGLYARIAELQELLADTRQRIRMASRAVLGGKPAPAGPCLVEVVVWGLVPGDGERLDPLLRALPETPVTLLLGSGIQAAEFRREHTAPLSVQDSEWRTPAAAWNEAMAQTQADVVVIVRPHVVPAPGAIENLATAVAGDGVAVASPVLSRPQGRFMGRLERSLLELAPLELRAKEGVEAVPFPSPEVFAVSRQAFHRLGAFDQDLVGDLALAEWTLRAAARTLRCVGVAESEWDAADLRIEEAHPAVVESDRLIVLSRHRPQQLAAAALAAQGLWQQEPMAVANVLRSVFRRLPNAAELSGAVDLLVLQAQTLAGWKRLAPALRERLAAVAATLGVPVADAVSDPGLVTLSEQIQVAAGGLRERLAAHEQELPRLQELQADCLARANTIDALRQELIEREQAIASLKEEHGKRVGERDRLIDHLARMQEDAEALQERVRLLEQQLQGETANLHSVLREIKEFRTGQEVLLAERSSLAEQSEELRKQAGSLQEHSQALERDKDQLVEQRDRLRVEFGSLQEQRVELESRAHELLVSLRERERWLVQLLQEVQTRRLRPRKLTAKEVEFLARQGFPAKP